MRWIGRRGLLRALVALLVATATSWAGQLPAAHADGAWLDDQSVSWNAAGMAIPSAMEQPPEIDPRCARQARPAESDEDRAIQAAGWTLFSNYTAGWGIKIVSGLADYDGMCRPLRFQGFVFVDGKLAGTLSPTPMDSRTDGALSRTAFFSPDELTATYVRYTDQDALCCPSALSTVTYKIERSAAGPALLRDRTRTQPTGAAAPPAPSSTAASPPGSPSGRVHVVEPGDTLNRIAMRYGITVEALMQANGFADRSRILRIGERLVIPD